MTNLTTIKVTKQRRDDLRALADRHGVTLDEALRLLLRRERQRQMGDDAAQPLSDEDRAWVRGANRSIIGEIERIEGREDR